MERATVVALATTAWNLEALLRNPVRFGPRFVEPQKLWETFYTPINTFESTDDMPTKTSGIQTEYSSDSFTEMSVRSESLVTRPSIVLFPSDQLLHNWTSVRPSAPGLINVGNTCYLNAILQVLSHVPPFVQYLLSSHHSSQCRMDACVFCRMEEHVSKCYPADGTRLVNAFKPLGIVSALKWISKRFQPYRQEDAHEFLRCLLGEMQRSCISAYKHLDFASQETTVIYKIFGGYLRQEVKCLRCNDISDTYPVYLDLSLDLMGSSVEEALAMYVRAEKLTESNRYKCEKCNVLVDFQKQSTIYILPPILTLHLKRFSFNKASKMFKISRYIRYGETLELGPYMSQKKEKSIMYDLIGVVVHSGNDTRCGHYYSFCKSSNGTWMHFNDERVSTVSLQTVLKQQAYILLYSRSSSSSKQKKINSSDIDHSESNNYKNVQEINSISLKSFDKFEGFKENHDLGKKILFKKPNHILSPPEIHIKPGIEWSKPILCKDSDLKEDCERLNTKNFIYHHHHGFIIPSPPPSPKELMITSGNISSSTFVAKVFDLYRKNPRAMLRNERRWLGALAPNRRKQSRVPLRRRPKSIVRTPRPTTYTTFTLPNHKPKQSSREHYAHTHSFDVANTPYELLPDFCPPTSTLDKINHPRPLRAEWKGIPLDLSNDPHVDQLHPAEVYLASQLRLPAMVYLDNKRRIFAEYHARKEAGLGFRRTDAQRCARIDVNKASRLWQAFERVGWLD
ncbi:hypothetical protein PCANB_001427 [Pneumocystis canis]|nr:hypothetical protein PCK1_001595 [Pneumocystis canis]KAG5439128.1 hypothetical protein PCANB_001427 [Pneumocystis canis]